MARAKSMSCDTTTSVFLKSSSARSSLATSRTSRGSSAEVGSSKSTTAGSIARALAIATRCCWPPESCAG
jgi:hypothetical protein